MEKIIDLLNNPLEISSSDMFVIEDGVKKYPYFQPLRLIYLKAVENDEQKLKKSLQKAAIFTQNRELLFEYVKSKTTKKQLEKDLSVEIKEEIISQENNEKHYIEEEANITEVTQPENALNRADENNNEIDEKSIELKLSGNYKFNQWLNATKEEEKDIKEEEDEDDNKFKIIDEFLNKNPKITPAKEFKSSSSLNIRNKDLNLSHLMTETLANIYAEQGKYSKAIKAFNILRLKYPEKSGYFADQIKKIEELK